MTDTDKIDLSLQVNQNRLAISLSTFYTVEELEQIELSKLRCPYDQIATHPCGCMEYSRDFNDGKSFQLHCTIDTSVVPNTHYISIRLISELYVSEFKCNPHTNNVDFMDFIIKKSINYKKYKDPTDNFYNKIHILENFADKMIVDLGKSERNYLELKERFMKVEKRCDELHGKVEGHVNIDFEVSSGTFKVNAHTIDDHIFMFSYTNNITNVTDYCYFLRGHVGLDMLIICIDRCINKIRLSNIDKGIF